MLKKLRTTFGLGISFEIKLILNICMHKSKRKEVIINKIWDTLVRNLYCMIKEILLFLIFMK
jgi:hypothetical protein